MKTIPFQEKQKNEKIKQCQNQHEETQIIMFRDKQKEVKINVALEYQLEFLEWLKIDAPSIKIKFFKNELRQIDTIFLEILKKYDCQNYFFDSAPLFLSDAAFYSIRDKQALTLYYLKKALIDYVGEILDPNDVEEAREEIRQTSIEQPCKVISFRKV